MEDKKYPEALAHWRQMRWRNPDNPRIALQLARCLDQLDQQEETESLLEDGSVRYPQFSPCAGRARAWPYAGVSWNRRRSGCGRLSLRNRTTNNCAISWSSACISAARARRLRTSYGR